MSEPLPYLIETLWEDEENLLYRLLPVSESAARLALTPISAGWAPKMVSGFENAYALRNELDSTWATRPLAVEHYAGRPTLFMEDPGGELLAQLVGKPWDLAVSLHVAIGMTVSLGQLHARGLIHKDIKPANFLVNRAAGKAWLTGFGIASRLPRERQSPQPPEFIAGTVAYMAPEQTGRMNRSIDSRSDLYSLGVTLYEMLTGSLPFTATDPMEWIHCHIARQPLPPGERVPGIPVPLAAIVMKLLSKNAEDRYQTAAGVEADLRRCLAQWEALGRIDPFPLGAQDISNQLLIPEKLYGREQEIRTLLEVFDRVVTHGTTKLVLVSGYAGIGKSSVVNELHKVLVPSRGLFASGKFDQYKRDIPYATLAQAFQSLVRQLLSKSGIELARWRSALLEAVGLNGQLMVNLIPELALIIGEQPPVSDLPPQDAQRRFQLVFRRFIAVFARPEHPLALFLDDLQWLDVATLDLLEDLLSQRDVRHLMLIGAYRGNEVDSAHPLVRKLEAIRRAGAKVQEIVLTPLAREDLGRLIADSLHCEPERTAPLSQLVHEKTAGNPFFAIQFVYALAEEGLLTFDHGAARWSWELNRMHAKGYTDNVVDLMVGKLNRLPAETQKALQQLACIGNSAQFAVLRMVYQDSNGEMHDHLWDAVRTDLIFRSEDSYRFLHDRVQEAAYSLIPESARGAAHLRIGRLLTSQTAPEEIEENIFEIVNQLNRGSHLVTSVEEREQVAELNLIAGKRAKTSTAYASALNYLIAGAALLAEDAGERRHELTFALELNRAECEFLTGALAEAEQRLTALSARAATTVDRASVTCLRADLYTTLDQGSRAIAVGLDYLRHLGIDWSPHPTEDEARREYERIWSQLGSRAIEELIDLPLMSNPASLATLDVLTKLGPPAWHTDANLLSLVICRAVNLSIEGGNCDGSCYAYVVFGLLAGPRFGDYEAGFRFGRLGYELVEQRGLKRFQARTYFNFGSIVMPWTRHVRAGRDLVRRAFEAANNIGDLTFAAYCYAHLNTNLLAAGDRLDELQAEAERGFAFAQKMRFGFAIDSIAAQLGLIRTLRGSTPIFGCFDNEQFDEVRVERRFSSNPDLALPECWYWIRKLQARFFAGDYAGAIDASERAQRLLWTSPSMFETAEYHFYSALSQAASCESAAAGQRRQHVEALVAHHRQLEIWAANCPENFENRAALAGAEIARIEGRVLDAEHLYEQAIRSAHANGFVHNEALAYEVAAGFYAARGFDKIAATYLREAREGYVRWGAIGKVRQLDQIHPDLREEPAPPRSTSTIGTSIEHLDLATIIKVSQAVSSEIDLKKLFETLLVTALEHAGAERGLLIIPRGDELRIEAEATTNPDTVEVFLRQTVMTPADLPESMLHFVIRTQESLVLDDGLAPNQFSTDEYIRTQRARSMLCLPLVKQARLTGLLYLENKLTPQVFTPARIAVLKLLASQAAIALENARLYDELTEREARIRRLVEANIIGIVIWDIEGRIIEANEAFLRMVGYSREDLLSGVVSWRDVTPDKWRAADEQALAELAAIGTCEPFEKEYFRKDGSRVPVLVGPALLEGSQEKGVAFVLDLTERKRAEDRLRRSEAYLAEAQRLSLTGSFGWNVSTGEIFWSDETYRIVGLDRGSKPTLREVFQRVHPEDIARVRETLDRGIQSGTDLDFEHRLLMPDGSVKHVRVVGRPSRQDASGDLEFVGAVTDISERKQLEAQLLEGQQRFRLLSESSLTGIYLIQGGRFRYVNPIMARMFGYEIEEVVDRLGPLDLTYPDDRHIVGENVRRRIEGEAEEMHYDFRGLRKDGSVFYVEVHGRRIEHGGMIGVIGTLIDITERKWAEEERQAHLWFLESMDQINRAIQGTSDLEQMMSNVLDAVLAIFNCDRAWLVYPCDPEAPSWGVPMEHTRPEFPGAFALGLDLPLDPETAKVFQTVRASSSPVRFGPASEHALPMSVAARFNMQSVIAMAVYPKGDKPYMLGLHQCSYPRVWTPQEERLFQEIGRRLEDALTSLSMFRNMSESQRKLEEAQCLAHVGHWEYAPDTDLIIWSDETYRIFGLQPQARMPNLAQLLELIHPDDRQIMVQASSSALRGGSRYDIEYRVIRPNGEVRLVHSQGDVTMVESGRPRRMFGTVQDITERKRAEQRLMLQHTVTRILAEATTFEEVTPKILESVCESLQWEVGALWSIDRHARVLRCVEVWHGDSVNVPRFEALCRQSTFPSGIGLPGRVWSSGEAAYIPDVSADANFPRASSAASEGLHAAFGFPVLLGGEVLAVLEFFIHEIRQPEQELLNMMVTLGSQIGQFIEAKRAEEKLHKAQAELAHVTRVTTLGELTASIAHEVNQPLTAIVANANASLRWLGAARPNLDEARQAVRRILRDGNRASDVIGRIRALVKKGESERLSLDINEAIQEVVGLTRSEIQNAGVTLKMNLYPGLPPIEGDRIQLQQVILNLVMNAIDAMSTVVDRPREMLIRSTQFESDKVLVTVQDSGFGIDSQNLENIFNTFFTTKSQGMGMGLAISRSIVESHGGQLWVEPNDGPGVSFQFTLLKY